MNFCGEPMCAQRIARSIRFNVALRSPNGEGFTVFMNGLPAILLLFRQTLLNDRPEFRFVDLVFRQRSWVKHEDRADEGVVVCPFERSFARGDFVKHHGKRPNIRAMIDITSTTGLFGRHVVRAAQDHAGLCGFSGNVVVVQFGNAEVDDFRNHRATIIGDKTNVVRLEIAVNDAFSMRRSERSSDGEQRSNGTDRGQTPFALQRLRERFSLQNLHHDERICSFRRTKIEDAHDAGMTNSRRSARFLEQAHRSFSVGVIVTNQLDRDVDLEREVSREPHGAHPAFTKDLRQSIFVRDDVPSVVRHLRQTRWIRRFVQKTTVACFFELQRDRRSPIVRTRNCRVRRVGAARLVRWSRCNGRRAGGGSGHT